MANYLSYTIKIAGERARENNRELEEAIFRVRYRGDMELFRHIIGD